MSWLPNLKNPILAYIEENPGVGAVEIAHVFSETVAVVSEYIEVLHFDNRLHWVETPHGFRYYAHPRPTSWEVLLRDDFMV